jgi:tetratricopeptide (TPR) repeat protein
MIAVRHFLILAVCMTAQLNAQPIVDDRANIDAFRTERYLRVLTLLSENREELQLRCQQLSLEHGLLTLEVASNANSAMNLNRAAYREKFFAEQERLAELEGSNRRNSRTSLRASRKERQDPDLLMASANEKAMRAQQGRLILDAREGEAAWVLERMKWNHAVMQMQQDWMGRRSRSEHEMVLKYAEKRLVHDPLNDGLAAVRATSFRSLGRDVECIRQMELNKTMLPAYGVHLISLQTQIVFLDRDEKELLILLEEIGPLGVRTNTVEPLLVAGWIAVARQEWRQAIELSNRLRNMAPWSVEGAVLMAWVQMEIPDPKPEKAYQSLRSVIPYTAEDEWYFAEAAAHSLAAKGRWAESLEQIQNAIRVAPESIRSHLAQQEAMFHAKQIPEIDWDWRLRTSWRLP